MDGREHGDEETWVVTRDTDAVWSGQRGMRFAEAAGLSRRAAWEFGIVVSELVTNAVRHGLGGTVRLAVEQTPAPSVVLVVEDRGPGIADLELALADGYSKGRPVLPEGPLSERSSLGTGLGAVKRLSDELSIENREVGGLRVMVRKWLRDRST